MYNHKEIEEQARKKVSKKVVVRVLAPGAISSNARNPFVKLKAKDRRAQFIFVAGEALGEIWQRYQAIEIDPHAGYMSLPEHVLDINLN